MLALAAAIVFAGGCGSMLSPRDVRMVFSLSDTSQLQSFAATGGKHAVTVKGGINVPSTCAARGSFAVVAQTIDATVEVVPVGGASTCPEPSVLGNYTITFSDVPAGQWAVRLNHKQAGKESSPVYQDVVDVNR